MEKERPDLVLLDRMLTGMQIDEVLRHIPDVPAIVLSARCEVEGKVKLQLSGATERRAAGRAPDENVEIL